MFEVGDEVRRKPGEEYDGIVTGTLQEPSQTAIGLWRVLTNTGETHNWDEEFFEVVEPVVAAPARRVGDFSHEPTQRLTSETGASKGMRVTRHDLIPPAALREVAAVYGFGELKYPAGEDGPNWLRGMPFSWNERAALDHISQWREGVDFDTEDGVHHLAHAIWHFLAILEFEARGIGKDDRPYKDKPGGE